VLFEQRPLSPFSLAPFPPPHVFYPFPFFFLLLFCTVSHNPCTFRLLIVQISFSFSRVSLVRPSPQERSPVCRRAQQMFYFQRSITPLSLFFCEFPLLGLYYTRFPITWDVVAGFRSSNAPPRSPPIFFFFFQFFKIFFGGCSTLPPLTIGCSV